MHAVAVSGQVESPLHFVADLKARHLSFLFLTFILLASIGVRAGAWHHWPTGAIESEGAEYARIAENLRNGRGYVGISTPGAQLVFPPLFPSLIATASLITHNDYELAGRLVAFLLGALLPLPVFGIANRLFDRHVAAIAAVLTVVYPVFVSLSFSVLSEGPYTTILLGAVYLVLHAFDRPSILNWFFVGGAFGAAYLTRQEAIGPFLAGILLGLIAGDDPLFVKAKRALVAVAVFMALASPQVLLLYRSTGKLRLEEKSLFNYAWGIRVMNAETGRGANESIQDIVYEAANSINDRLESTGVAMRPNAEIIRETHVSFKDAIRFFGEAVYRNTPELFGKLREKWLGAPFLPALACLGVVRRPWPRRMAFHQLFFILVPTIAVMTTFTVVHAIYVRNYFILAPFLLIWGANGLFGVVRWTNRSIAAIFERASSSSVPGGLTAGLIVVVMLAYALKDTRNLFVFRESSSESRGAKDAGLWIKHQQARRVRVMDVIDTVAFHADADYVHFPSCAPDLAIAFMQKEKVDYIIFRRGFEQPKYYKNWLTSGSVPDARAKLVYTTGDGDPSGILVFRWDCAKPLSSGAPIS